MSKGQGLKGCEICSQPIAQSLKKNVKSNLKSKKNEKNFNDNNITINTMFF